jgi:glycogen synthase
MAQDETGQGVTGQVCLAISFCLVIFFLEYMYKYIYIYIHIQVQLVMMGNGEERYANFLKNAEAQNKGKVCGFVGFTPELEHKIIAGAGTLPVFFPFFPFFLKCFI